MSLLDIITNIFELPFELQELIWQQLPYLDDEPQWITKALSKYANDQRLKHTFMTDCICKSLIYQQYDNFSFISPYFLHAEYCRLCIIPNITHKCPSVYHKCICKTYNTIPMCDKYSCYNYCRARTHYCICPSDIKNINKKMLCRCLDCPNKSIIDHIRNQQDITQSKKDKANSRNTILNLYNATNRHYAKHEYKGKWQTKRQPLPIINYPPKAKKSYR